MIIGQLDSLKFFFTKSQKGQDFCLDTVSKILKISGLILAVGVLLVSVSFAMPLTLKITAAVSIAGSCAVFFVFCRTHSIKNPDKHSLLSLWDRLEDKTRLKLGKMAYVDLGNRCRFDGIRCPKHTAISVDDNYLHANSITIPYCSRAFVASQAPLPEDDKLFWQAVFERKAVIIDLTTPEDRKHEGKEQVTSYYPEFLDQIKTYGNLSVTIGQKTSSTNIIYRVHNRKTGEEKRIHRLCHCSWKDFSAVSAHVLKELVETIDIFVPQGGIAWVHCRAGVGRTGTLIAAYFLREKSRRRELSLENLEEVLIESIIELRGQRGEFFVQQPVQLELLREYGRLLLSSEL